MTRKTAAWRGRRLYPEKKVYISGATIGNPGPGAWAVASMEGCKPQKMVKGARDTTNPRMVLKALECALESFPAEMDLIIRSNSEYAIKGMTRWRLKWVR